MFNEIIKRENSNIKFLLAGRIATNVADSLFYMTILWYFKIQFHSPVILSLVFVADSTIDMAAFLFGPLIDRVYIKKLIQFVTIFQITLSFIAVGFFLIEQKPTLLVISGLIFTYAISTIGSTLIYPAEEKILPVITSKSKLMKINGIFQMTYQTLDLVLDSLATIMITYLTINVTMISSGLIFAVALIFYSRLFLPRKLFKKESDYFSENYWQDLIKGWQVLRNEGRILALILPFAVTNLFYGIASIGLPYFSTTYLTHNATGYGAVEFASSIGGILGSIIVQRFNFSKEKLEKLVTLSLLCAGISVIFQALLAKYLSMWVLLLFILSATWISIMNINFRVLIQESFDSQILGRIETINTSIINCMIPIGSFIGGVIVQNFGSSLAIFLEGLAEVTTAIFYFIVFLRDK